MPPPVGEIPGGRSSRRQPTPFQSLRAPGSRKVTPEYPADHLLASGLLPLGTVVNRGPRGLLSTPGGTGGVSHLRVRLPATRSCRTGGTRPPALGGSTLLTPPVDPHRFPEGSKSHVAMNAWRPQASSSGNSSGAGFFSPDRGLQGGQMSPPAPAARVLPRLPSPGPILAVEDFGPRSPRTFGARHPGSKRQGLPPNPPPPGLPPLTRRGGDREKVGLHSKGDPDLPGRWTFRNGSGCRLFF